MAFTAMTPPQVTSKTVVCDNEPPGGPRIQGDYFKIDGLKLLNAPNQARLKQFFERVLGESSGKITLDLDITAEKRFGPLGIMEAGPLFVENRYTDWGRYHPHLTLRVLWTFSHWLDPLRLRLEWLNNARNDEKYGDDPLRPLQWQPDALFATVLLASPLGWFEVQNLPENYYRSAAPLVATWKTEREALRAATIVPLGEAPDGFAWTGFWALHRGGASYALVFREANAARTWDLASPAGIGGAVSILGGRGAAKIENGRLLLEIEGKLDFLWLKFESDSAT